ncbi:MAG: hypothetical protein IT304_08965 [Dehalococcoidia bacterium]|nr:hypothetical protein [Dehalococcoidia bacterium]
MSRRWMIDFDGVLADLQGAFVAAVNEKFDAGYTVEEIDDWHWWSRQPKPFAAYIWKTCYPDVDWTLEAIAPYPGAIEALADLLTDGEIAEELRIVTARPREHAGIIVKWLHTHLPHLDLSANLITAGRDYPKSHYCGIHRLDTVVEDGAHNLRVMNPMRQALYLVDRPWNQHDILPHVERVAGLEAAVASVVAMEKTRG